MAQHIRPSGETETLVAIQVRLSEQEVGFCRNFYLRRFEVSSSSLSNRA